MNNPTVSAPRDDGNAADEVNTHPLESFKAQLIRTFAVNCDDDKDPAIRSTSQFVHIARFLFDRGERLTGDDYDEYHLGIAEALINRLSGSTPDEWYDGADPLLTAFHNLAGEFLMFMEEVERKSRKAA
jgi:hypothetical protein